MRLGYNACTLDYLTPRMVLMKKALGLLLCLALAGCVNIPTPLPQPTFALETPRGSTPLPQFPTLTPPAEDPVQVYFTSPGADPAGSDALTAAVAADIAAADTSVDIAMYNFSLKPVADALLAAHQRGVRVRMVTDSDALDGSQLQRLQSGGIQVIGDRREGLMHNKFIILDGAVVWMGSLNLTGSGTYNDNNNLVRFDSADLAQNYTTEFEEMFNDDAFGSGSPSNTPHPQVTLANGARVENYFSPEDGLSPRLVALLDGAQQSIDFLAYSFTSDPIADALIEQAGAGVQVRGVFDEGSYRSNTGGEFLRLQRAQLDVRLDGNPDLMHHKVMIIDGETVILGSYNFTRAADRTNDENVIVIHDAGVARQFLLEFEKIYSQSTP